MVADTNYTITPLSFKHETLFTDTKMTALVFSSRVGLRGAVTSSTHAALWAGAMYEVFLSKEGLERGRRFWRQSHFGSDRATGTW